MYNDLQANAKLQKSVSPRYWEVIVRISIGISVLNATITTSSCAHDVNILSTAKRLPRTPADVNDFLSVIFIGMRSQLKNAMTPLIIRKSKVCRFLYWLKVNNILYKDIEIDESNLNLYPDTGILPGSLEKAFVDTDTDPDEAFAEETSGIHDHPAVDIQNHRESNDTVNSYMEHTGMSDPEGYNISGRSFNSFK